MGLLQLFWRAPTLPAASLRSKTVIVTGANAGLGFTLCQQLAGLEAARIVMAVRSVERGGAAAETLRKQHPNTVFDVRHCDLEDFGSIDSFSEGLRKDDVKPSIAVLNAAVLTQKWALAANGNEMAVQVNVLGNALLALRLLPLLAAAATPDPRLVVVSSQVHTWTPFKEQAADSILKALNDEALYNVQDRYYSTKLVNLLWTYALARRVDGGKVKVVFAAPPFCKTDLFREIQQKFIMTIIMALFAHSAENGAKVIADAALRSDAAHGKYYCRKPIQTSKVSTTEALQERVWSEVEEVLKEASPSAYDSLPT